MSTAPVTTEAVQPIVSICEHIKDDGRRCGTPAIRGRHFCYYHSRAHAPAARIGSRGYRASLPETIESLQLMIMQVTEALGSGKITHQVAGKFLFSVQLSTNLLKMKLAASAPSAGAPFPVGAPSSASVAEGGEVEGSTDPVTDIPPAMEAVLTAPADEPPEESPEEPPRLTSRPVDDDDPEMPVTVAEAKRALLSPKAFVDHNNWLHDGDQLSPRYRKVVRRLALHGRAMTILEENGEVPSFWWEELATIPEKYSVA